MKIITLDTNVWLDLLLFHNPASLALAQQLAASGCQAAVSSASLRELHRVLTLKPLPRAEWQQAAAQLAIYLEALQASMAVTKNNCPLPQAWVGMEVEPSRSAQKPLTSTNFQPSPALLPSLGEGQAALLVSDYADAQLAGLQLLHCNASATNRLPQCRDSTDQMFLQLASASNSAVLLTRDKALLKCRNYPLNDASVSGQASGQTRGSVMTPAQLAASKILLI